ncbi:hypothetical protein FPV67DRAFT_740701 [Lyophyllum atratum]|nr:hypothetical protein FPV67DRAFT_740701 [Lyophyllum atratum]
MVHTRIMTSLILLLQRRITYTYRETWPVPSIKQGHAPIIISFTLMPQCRPALAHTLRILTRQLHPDARALGYSAELDWPAKIPLGPEAEA